MARAAVIARTSAAAVVLFGAGIGIGEADFRTAVPELYKLEESRQIAPGDGDANRLDAIDAQLGGTGKVEAYAAAGSESWCWQVNGTQVTRAMAARCTSLDAIAARMATLAGARDSLTYAVTYWSATKLGTSAVAWQVSVRLAVAMTCVPD